MRIGLIGYGKMGKAVEQAAIERGHTIAAIFTKENPISHENAMDCDLFVDFTTAQSVLSSIETAAKAKKNLVVGTTGWESSVSQAQKLVNEAGIGLLYSPNFSIGMMAFFKIAKEAAKQLASYDLAGFEAHHNKKLDAPSGTAIALQQACGKPFSFSSMRVGTLPGTHSLIFDSPGDTVTLTHQAKNRVAFAQGAVIAAEWLQDKKGVFTLEDLINV